MAQKALPALSKIISANFTIYKGIVTLSQWAHHKLAALQTGGLRWYATAMVFGMVLLLAIMLRNAT